MLEVTKTHEKGSEYLVARRSLIDGIVVLFFFQKYRDSY